LKAGLVAAVVVESQRAVWGFRRDLLAGRCRTGCGDESRLV